MARGLLAGALTFGAGFVLGLLYHSAASLAHASTAAGPDQRIRSLESRLASLEGRFESSLHRPAERAAEGVLRRRKLTRDMEKDVAKLTEMVETVGGHRSSVRDTGVDHRTTEPSEILAKHSKQRCPDGRKPYHVVLTAQDSMYQAWQTRLMYYHFRKQQRANPCTEMTGFTRLLSSSTPSVRDALYDEMPTVAVKQLDGGSACKHSRENSCDMGFPVMNRPHAVTQFLAQLPASLTEEYVMIAETDHLLMREPENRATPSKPVCYPFGYMNARAAELRPVVARWAKDIDKVDPCGPSPIQIHLPLLRKLTPEWLRLSFELKRDPQADSAFGWVLEMWGYTLAANRLGISHFVWNEFQVEPSALWHRDLEGDPRIYHYTFGLEFTLDGIPVSSIGDWSLDKRHYMGSYPPRALRPPPECAGKAARTLHALFNEPLFFYRGGRAHTPWGSASWELSENGGIVINMGDCGAWSIDFDESITSFSASSGGKHTHGRLLKTADSTPAAESALNARTSSSAVESPIVTRLLGTGPWAWQGVAPLAFLAEGVLHTPWGTGRWGVHDARPNSIFANFVNEEHIVTFDDCWSFTSRRVRDGDRASGGALIGQAAKQCSDLQHA